VKEFIARVLNAAPGGGVPAEGPEAEIAKAVEAAETAMAAGDAARAAEVYGLVLQHVPDHAPALIGLTNIYLKMGELPQARQTLAMVGESHHEDEAYKATATALQLAEEAEALGDGAELEVRLAANAEDHQARFDLAVLQNAKGDRLGAAELLIDLMKRDREWQDDGARKKLLELFEAWGPKDEATGKGRRMLSSVLFS
jgi:putative thioredoxin